MVENFCVPLELNRRNFRETICEEESNRIIEKCEPGEYYAKIAYDFFRKVTGLILSGLASIIFLSMSIAVKLANMSVEMILGKN